MLRGAVVIGAVLALTGPLQDRGLPNAPIHLGLRIVDPDWETEADPELERLAGQELHVEALERAVAQLATALRSDGPRAPRTLRALQRVGTVAHLGVDEQTAEQVFMVLVAARRKSPGRAGEDLADALIRLGRESKYRGDRRL